jgi:hypothetical protein
MSVEEPEGVRGKGLPSLAWPVFVWRPAFALEFIPASAPVGHTLQCCLVSAVSRKKETKRAAVHQGGGRRRRTAAFVGQEVAPTADWILAELKTHLREDALSARGLTLKERHHPRFVRIEVPARGAL